MTPHFLLRLTLGLYFALLITEGALRKWVLPAYSDVLFVVRDPLVVLAYVLAWRAGHLRWNAGLGVLWALASGSLLFALVGSVPWQVALFGLRTNYLHLPLIFVLASALDREDVRRFGLCLLWLALGVVILMTVQFNSPRDALVNFGVGGQESGQILGALDRVRPPGPFSFISGAVMFFGLVAAFVSAGWLAPAEWPRWLLLLATFACVAAVPVSISRSMLFAMLVATLAAALPALRDYRRLPRLLLLGVAIGTLLFTVLDSIYIEAFSTRWTEALGSGGGGFRDNVLGRMLDDYRQPFQLALEAPLTGHGVGLGTLAGARFATGKNEFLLAESEWSRVVLELGPVLGLLFIGWRVWLAFALLVRAWRHFHHTADPLAWCLAAAAFFPVLNAQWGPSTHLGFAVFTAGLCLAAMREPAEEAPAEQLATPDEPEP